MTAAPGPEASHARHLALLHEVDHRVKNNLQLISSLILLQSRRLENPAARDALRAALDRINAIGIVHQRLFRASDIEQFDIAEFVRDLVADLSAAAERPDIEVRLDLEHIDVPAAQAAPLALIVNELLTNALRHAFPADRPGLIEVRVRRLDGAFEIEVRDNGVGDDPADFPRGFGLTVADLLCRQLNADCGLAAMQPGVRATVRLPIKPKTAP